MVCAHYKFSVKETTGDIDDKVEIWEKIEVKKDIN